MTTDLSDPNTWTSTTDGGIPYRLLDGFPSFSFGEEGVTATEEYVIQGSRLTDFVSESLPLVDFSGEFITPSNGRTLPGTPHLYTREVEAVPHIEGKIGDPFSVRAGNIDVTDLYRVTIKYETRAAPGAGIDSVEGGDDDNQAPETFLQHSMNIGGEFLTIPPKNLKMQRDGETPADNEGNIPTGDPTPVKDSSASDNEDQLAAISKIIPITEHTLDWRAVVEPPWGRIRNALGRVNSDTIPLFNNAAPETVLFMGVSARQEYRITGRNRIFRVPWSMSFKFSEKGFRDEGGIVVTWNHFWRPKTGQFEIVFRGKSLDQKVYTATSFADIFKRDRTNTPRTKF